MQFPEPPPMEFSRFHTYVQVRDFGVTTRPGVSNFSVVHSEWPLVPEPPLYYQFFSHPQTKKYSLAPSWRRDG